MRLFVSEYVTGGSWPLDQTTPTLLREGTSMLAAIAADFARILDCRVATTYDARCGSWPGPQAENIEVHMASTPSQEQRLFRRLAAGCDLTFVIAPEFGGILADRCRIVEEVGGRLLGPPPETVDLCSDKFALAAFLEGHSVTSIETEVYNPNVTYPDERFPMVIKPRDGAGSQRMRLIESAADFNRTEAALRKSWAEEPTIIQPYVTGTPLSIAAILSHDGASKTILPPAEQHLTRDGRFEYLGGRVPAACAGADAIRRAADAVLSIIPGLNNGWVGIDMILPDGPGASPRVVEINSRLTTSYLGYRALTRDNLAQWLIGNRTAGDAITWQPGFVEFDADGTLRPNKSTRSYRA